MTVYKVARRRYGRSEKSWAVRNGTIRLGETQRKHSGEPEVLDTGRYGGNYRCGIHACLTRDGARAYRGYLRRQHGMYAGMTMLRGRITGEIVAKGTQAGVPVVVVTSVVWEKVVR